MKCSARLQYKLMRSATTNTDKVISLFISAVADDCSSPKHSLMRRDHDGFFDLLPNNVEGVEDQDAITSNVPPKLKKVLKRERASFSVDRLRDEGF